MSSPIDETLKVDAEQPRGQRRESILDAATDLFATHGFNDADTQALAEKLGVGKGTLYRCFASKQDLFLAAVDRVMLRLGARVESSGTEAHDPIERISRAVRAYLAFFSENPQYVELLIQERALFKDRKRPTYFDHRERRADYWRSIYAGLISDRRVREIPVDQIRDVMNQLLYGTIFTNYFSGRFEDPEEQARAILDIFFVGILSESERRKPESPALTRAGRFDGLDSD